VLVTGGYELYTQSSAELYDPSTGSWTTAGKMKHALPSFTASKLTNGRVLITDEANDMV
jgi:hypothetical protein